MSTGVLRYEKGWEVYTIMGTRRISVYRYGAGGSLLDNRWDFTPACLYNVKMSARLAQIKS